MNNTFGFNISIAGISISGTSTRTTSGTISEELTLGSAKSGTLTTRTDANTGTLTLESGHGVTTASTIDIYWDGGRQYNVTVGTVSGTSVPFDSGAGDDLPTATTAVTVQMQNVIDIDFDGDLLECAAALSSERGRLQFFDSGGLEFGIDLAEGEPWIWLSDGSETNPVVGDDITYCTITTASTDGANFKMGIGYDSV
jgi:hypothetical protein